jgi:hypothetical protein
MHRDIVWEWVDRPGLEHLALDITGDGITAESLIVAAFDGVPIRLRYRISCDGAWQVREAALTLDGAAGQRTARLERGTDGAWRVDGMARPDLAGCADIDIRATPFTNTLPIRRQAMQPQAPMRFRMAYIDVPSLAISALDQEYVRLDPATPPRRFLYRNIVTPFEAELALDTEGVVIDYPPVWRRRAP